MGKVAKWEDDLIHPNEWRRLYDSMPQRCKDLMDDKDIYALGIGKNEELGWFIAMSGQGPVILWTEKKICKWTGCSNHHIYANNYCSPFCAGMIT